MGFYSNVIGCCGLHRNSYGVMARRNPGRVYLFFESDDLARLWMELLLGDDELRSLLIKQKKAALGLDRISRLSQPL